jgi:hypothetical protein
MLSPDETRTPVVYLVIKFKFLVIMKHIIGMINLGKLAEKGCFSSPGFFVEKKRASFWTILPEYVDNFLTEANIGIFL